MISNNVKPNIDEIIKTFSTHGIICLYLNIIASNMATKLADVTDTGTYGSPHPIEPQKTEKMLRIKKSGK
jgi:hypothetical protein